MQPRLASPQRRLLASPHRLASLLLLATASIPTPAQPPPPDPAATAAFLTYTEAVEARLLQQHRTPQTFLAAPGVPNAELRLHHGDLLLEPLTPANAPALPGAMLHHWRGTAFVPGAHAADFERLLRDLPAYPRHFAPQVLQARLLSAADPDHLQTSLRVREHHVLTVVLDSTYIVAFDRLDPHHRDSTSRSTHLAEIADPGTAAEHALSPADEHGFLWRLNTYWTWEERPDGLYLQIETVSLSRAIPQGLAWALHPYTESIPRDSLTFTLRSTRSALIPLPR